MPDILLQSDAGHNAITEPKVSGPRYLLQSGPALEQGCGKSWTDKKLFVATNILF